jgi:predicted nucleotidyltransferase
MIASQGSGALETLGVVLFGSYARGDNDALSDRDICAFIEAPSIQDRPRLKQSFAAEYSTQPESVCIYSRATSDYMAESGSLFLWHLKLEGVVLVDSDGWVGELYNRLRPYSGYERDLATYWRIFDDVEADLASGREITEAELHALFVVCRNTCLLLTMRCGRPRFGREQSLEVARDEYGELSITNETYRMLARNHIRYIRGAALELADDPLPKSEKLLREVRGLLAVAEKVVLQ